MIAFGIIAISLLIDWIFKTGLWQDILSHNSVFVILGLSIIFISCIAGAFSQHRTFTHSLLFVLLLTIGFSCISLTLSIPVLVGGLSHLIIDTFNYKPVPWLYPVNKKGICFKLCYANKEGDKFLMWIGLGISIVFLIIRIVQIIK